MFRGTVLRPSSLHFILKLEVEMTSTTSYHITTRHRNPEDLNLNLYGRENLKSRSSMLCCL